ncbi:ribosomal protein S5 domain 2-type protein [Zychaea mexicana]|uniref:ribosomal protein S5 domain 2-type protein n=1 Tax=Zychaea mexicana TaxID=64656 RepID=UPI0022FE1F2D|nr:ribosomal protein S5 domain 2-type protein [Zychaea mexicana]KAI9498594.1 ribosomal protein S5 domain 2-type protein [Zychaea mexicana]
MKVAKHRPLSVQAAVHMLTFPLFSHTHSTVGKRKSYQHRRRSFHTLSFLLYEKKRMAISQSGLSSLSSCVPAKKLLRPPPYPPPKNTDSLIRSTFFSLHPHIMSTAPPPLESTSKSFEVFHRIQPHEYLRRFLEHSVRPDGRLLDSFRKTLITTGSISTANASAMVRLGGTTVVCGIKAEVCEPHVERPNQGYLVPNVELSPMCSPKFRAGPPPEKAQVTSEFIHQLFTNSDLFPLESLCIEEGKAVWVLYADIVCLNYDGNILDASLLALTAALSKLTLPKAQVSESMVVEADASNKSPVFQMTRVPIASTFCVFQEPMAVLSDPNEAEEALTKETVTVVMDSSGQVCHVSKNGGNSIESSALRTCFERAVERTKEMATLIEQA